MKTVFQFVERIDCAILLRIRLGPGPRSWIGSCIGKIPNRSVVLLSKSLAVSGLQRVRSM